MFDFTGIFHGHLLRDPQTDEHLGQNGVPLIDLFCNVPPLLRQVQAAVLLHGDQVPLAQQAHGPGDAGLGVAQILPNINRTDKAAFAGQHQNGFQIHFAGFVDVHRSNTPIDFVFMGLLGNSLTCNLAG